MKVLYVYAHPEPKSFNGALKETALAALQEKGHKEEMEKVKWADLLIFQFPIFFTFMPAIMKGWIDRVLAPGFGFNPVTNSDYDTGLLKGKSAMIVATTGAPKAMYSEGGAHGDLNKHLESITHCIFEYMGMEVLPSYIIYEVSSMSRERGAEELEEYRHRILDL